MIRVCDNLPGSLPLGNLYLAPRPLSCTDKVHVKFNDACVSVFIMDLENTLGAYPSLQLGLANPANQS